MYKSFNTRFLEKKHWIKLKPTWIFTPEFEASYLYFSNFVKLSAP